MIERSNGFLVLTCDECGGDFDGTHAPDEFHQLIADARNAGWAVYRHKGEWTHECPTCRNTEDFNVEETD